MFRKKIKIGRTIISKDSPVFFIAEAGVNHNGDLRIAKRLIDAAKSAGADAVKFQTFKTENLSTKYAPKSSYHIETTGDKQSWFDLLKTQELNETDHRELFSYCRKKGIIFLSTPYDNESADLLNSLGVGLFKVASTDANNIPFLIYLAKFKKPIILSTGMCSLAEIKESVAAIKKSGCRDLVLLHCTSNYPAKDEDTNLLSMKTLAEDFDCLVGFSDHSLNFVNPIAAVALGAVCYEKHFTLDNKMPGPDHRASANPAELRRIIGLIRQAEIVMGSGNKQLLPSEKENVKKLRKSIVAAKDINKGETLNNNNLTCKRPGFGLAPKNIDNLIGKRAKRKIKKDMLIRMSDAK